MVPGCGFVPFWDKVPPSPRLARTSWIRKANDARQGGMRIIANWEPDCLSTVHTGRYAQGIQGRSAL